jgi:hypothetical protein
MEETLGRARPVSMIYNSHTHLEIARARHEDMIREAEHARLVRSFQEDRPGTFSRLRAHLARKRQPQPRPVTA